MCRLYLITPQRLDPKSFAETLKRALDAGDVASLQLRLKGVPDDEILRAGEILMPICHAAGGGAANVRNGRSAPGGVAANQTIGRSAPGTAFIVNDRPDLAVRMGADGVHVGQEDVSCAQARAAVGPDRIVGVSCHDSRHLAIEAAEAGADYVAFGALFPTTTKTPKTRCDIDVIRAWSQATIVPCVAIGGITVENAKPIVEAGADFIAVSSGVWDAPQGPAAAVKAFNALLRDDSLERAC